MSGNKIFSMKHGGEFLITSHGCSIKNRKHILKDALNLEYNNQGQK